MLPDEQPVRQHVKPEQAHEEGPQPWPTAACWPVCMSHHVPSRCVCHCLTTPEQGSRRVQNARWPAGVRIFRHFQTALGALFVPLHAVGGTPTRLRAALIPVCSNPYEPPCC